MVGLAFVYSHIPGACYQLCYRRHPERPYLTSSMGERHEAFDTPLGKVGLLICWDLAFPEAFRELISQGAKTIIIPTFWGLNDCGKLGLGYNPSSEIVFINSTLITRAFENTCGLFLHSAMH
jgi:predicted amidohydrolase